MFHATLQEIEIVAARIVLAYGVIDELPQIEGLQAKWGAGVLHCPYCHGFEVADQRLASLWTGEASLPQVKILKDWSDSVVLLANGAEMSDEAKKELDARKIAVDFRPVRRVRGPGNNIESVEFEDGNALPVDALFLISRVRLASDLAERLGCKLTEGPFGPYVITNDLRETSEQGIYAAGDMARPIHNATWAASDGVMAGIFCHQSLIVGANPYAARAR
jgi:thioredoxin reductase